MAVPPLLDPSTKYVLLYGGIALYNVRRLLQIFHNFLYLFSYRLHESLYTNGFQFFVLGAMLKQLNKYLERHEKNCSSYSSLF
jgi:uncharacterized membrane protein (DUF373 family)